jgi:acetyl esterase/lipase
VWLPERHPYGTARSQYGELFLPAGGGPWPVAVVLHGGFWRAQYGRKLMRPLCADLAARGWAAFNVEYRRLGRLSGGGFPRTLDDVAAAVDHLAELPAHSPVGAARTGGGGSAARALDLARVVAIGHSAGGHLAAWLATRAEARVPVTAFVAQAGVVDLRLASELGLSRGVVHRLLGGTPGAVPERYAAASPAERLPLGVPALLTHGGRDDIVPPVMSERFAAAARAAGDDVEVVVEPDEGHFGHLDPANPLWRAVTTWLSDPAKPVAAP